MIASTRSTRWDGSSSASSRVPVARPITATPHRNGSPTPRITVHPVAPGTSVAWPTASPHAAKLVIRASARSILEPLRRRKRLLRAGAALDHTAHVAHDADEGTALHARIPFRRALLVATRTTAHGVALAQLSHPFP